MADVSSVELAQLVRGNLVQASPDLLRAMVKTFAEALMVRRRMRAAAPRTDR